MENTEENSLNKLFANTEYKVSNNCLYKEIHKKDNVTTTKKLCNFVPYAKNETLLDDGIEKQRLLTIGCIHCSGRKMPDIRISSNEFNTLNWINRDWGLQCNVETGQMVRDSIRHAIQCTANNIDIKHIYTHTGWQKIDGKWIFLCNNLYLDENIEVNIELQGKLSRYSLLDVTKRNINEDLQNIKKLLDENFIPHKIMLPLLGITFLSPLNHFLKMADCEPKIVLFLIGKTGARKSTLASLMLSFFGNFTNTDLPISFRDTDNSIIEQTFLLKDVLTVIDDYHPSGSSLEEKMMTKIAQTIMRAYGDRIGKNKLKRDSTLKVSRPPRGNAILTGESVPDISESGTARYIIVELQQKDINLEKLTEVQNLARDGVFQSIMSCFIRKIYLTANTDFMLNEMCEELRIDFLQGRAVMQNELENREIIFHPRIPEALAWIWIGFDRFLRFLMDYKVIQNAEANELYSDILQILIDLAIQQSKSTKEDNPSVKFVTKLNALIESKNVHIEEKQNYMFAGGTNFIGYEDSDYYYLIPDMAHKVVKKLCDEQGESFPSNKKGLLKHLAEDGFIEVEQNSNTKALHLGDKKVRFIWLKKDKFNSTIS